MNAAPDCDRPAGVDDHSAPSAARAWSNASTLGFTNVTDRCYTNAVTVFVTPAVPLQDTAGCGVIDPVLGAANIDHFLYWDNIHPTSRVQAMWAQGFAATVPEPTTLTLLGLGLVILVFIGRRGVA